MTNIESIDEINMYINSEKIENFVQNETFGKLN
jgi:hypothetical protein